MTQSFNTPFLNQRVIQDRRLHPTPFTSVFRFSGRRKAFRRKGEGQNRYVDCLSLRTYVLALLIFTLSTLDAIFTFINLQMGRVELNPFMRQLIQTDFQLAFIIKSLGVGLVGCFLAIHQNFKIGFYATYVLTAIYSVLLGYHLVCSYL
jgi:Domain of unknown function (DUF5658)